MGMNEEIKNEKKADVLETVEQTIRNVHEKIRTEQETVFARYPLTFSLLGTLGVAAVIHGFEGIVDATPILADRPILIFISGLVLLFATGGLYKYLRR